MGDWSYTICTFYRNEIGQKLGLPGQCRKKVEIKLRVVKLDVEIPLSLHMKKYAHDDNILCLVDDEVYSYVCLL